MSPPWKIPNPLGAGGEARSFSWSDTVRRLPGEIIMALAASWIAYNFSSMVSALKSESPDR